MRRLLLTPAAACLLLVAACGGTAPTLPTATPPASASPSPPGPTAVALQAEAQTFAALNTTANAALTAASAQLQAATTLDQAKAAVARALSAYLAFDTGVQHLVLPTSMSADVTTQLHADAQVEADYQNAGSDTSLSQMQSTLSTVVQDSNTAGAATIVLRRDLGLPPTS